MAVNVNYFLQLKYREFYPNEAIKTDGLYDNISNENLKHLFAIIHHNFNELFSFMYRKGNGHFNAHESRLLLGYIKLYDDMKYVLKSTTLSFELDAEYETLINQCRGFVVENNGSPIPSNLLRIELKEYEPIFSLSQTVTVKTRSSENHYPSKMIGEGSYAHVYKYKDTFYDKIFAYKQAKKDLEEKEIERFKLEYETMKSLRSPYILEVYNYDENSNTYYMEFADESLYNYISRNNDKLSISRRINLVKQVFRAFSYIHSKAIFHRDISYTNILLQHYDNLIVVKVSDFGLVKVQHSTLTSFGTEIKGSLNDPQLEVIGFNNYSMEHETYALTRLIFYTMTGKHSIEKIANSQIKNFVLKGVNPDLKNRYTSIAHMEKYFDTINWNA